MAFVRSQTCCLWLLRLCSAPTFCKAWAFLQEDRKIKHQSWAKSFLVLRGEGVCYCELGVTETPLSTVLDWMWILPSWKWLTFQMQSSFTAWEETGRHNGTLPCILKSPWYPRSPFSFWECPWQPHTLPMKVRILWPLVSPVWPLGSEAWPRNGRLISKHSEPCLLFLITEHG